LRISTRDPGVFRSHQSSCSRRERPLYLVAVVGSTASIWHSLPAGSGDLSPDAEPRGNFGKISRSRRRVLAVLGRHARAVWVIHPTIASVARNFPCTTWSFGRKRSEFAAIEGLHRSDVIGSSSTTFTLRSRFFLVSSTTVRRTVTSGARNTRASFGCVRPDALWCP
jgi:hypothetical protein